MRVAIVDDEEEMRKQLTDYVQQFSRESGIALEAVTFNSGDSFLNQYRKVYDIIIFDVDMPGRNGIETARELRKTDNQVTIIFVTNIAQYAINGYEVDAVDYIIKPISYYDFSMKFHRTVSKAAQSQDRIIELELPEGRRRVAVKEIRCVEVIGHYLYFYLGDREYRVRGTIKDIEGELDPYGFVKIHRSYLVNIRYIEKITGKEVTVEGKTYSIGRPFKENLKDAYLKYIRGEV